jgi:hypothetical protein
MCWVEALIKMAETSKVPVGFLIGSYMGGTSAMAVSYSDSEK